MTWCECGGDTDFCGVCTPCKKMKYFGLSLDKFTTEPHTSGFEKVGNSLDYDSLPSKNFEPMVYEMSTDEVQIYEPGYADISKDI